MSKHVFDSNYSWFSHHGEYVRETDKFVVVTGRYGKQRESRVKKGSNIHIIDCDYPNAVSDAYREAWKRGFDAVKAANDVLREAFSAQRSSALAAAMALANPTYDED